MAGIYSDSRYYSSHVKQRIHRLKRGGRMAETSFRRRPFPDPSTPSPGPFEPRRAGIFSERTGILIPTVAEQWHIDRPVIWKAGPAAAADGLFSPMADRQSPPLTGQPSATVGVPPYPTPALTQIVTTTLTL